MPDELEAKVMQILADVLDVPPSRLRPDSGQSDIDSWDSLAIINIVAALEAELGISIPIDDAADLVSVSKVLEVVRTQRPA